MTRKEMAKQRVIEGLGELQEAQNHVGAAMEAISPVIGCVGDWERLRKLYEQVKGEWYRLEQRLKTGDLDLDGSVKVAEEA